VMLVVRRTGDRWLEARSRLQQCLTGKPSSWYKFNTPIWQMDHLIEGHYEISWAICGISSRKC
jgi:hypothetical protein